MDALRERLLPPVTLAVIGFAVFALGAAGVGFVHLGASVEQTKETALEHNAAMSQRVTRAAISDIQRLLERDRNGGLDGRSDDAEIDRLRQTIHDVVANEMALHPSIFKLAVIAPDGHTVFASDETRIGAGKRDDAAFGMAMARRTDASVTFQEQLETAEGGQTDRDVVLSYHPLMASASKSANTVPGVFEIQADVTVQKGRIYRTLLLELGIGFATFSVIFVLLLTIVRVSNHRLIDNYRQQRRLAHSVTRAEEANSAKSAFLADVSHQLRTPLNAIIGFSEILKDEAFGPLPNDQYKSYAGDIHDSGRRLLAIITDLLDLTRIQSGQAELREESFSLAECLTTTTRMMSAQPQALALSFECDLQPNLPHLYGDKSAVEHILQDLLSNAIKFTLGGSITVTARTSSDYALEFSVADTGIGMPEEELQQLNQRFSQIEVSWKRKFEGTGLGLALVKALMNQHGGNVTIDSELGVGTTVTCRFPRQRTLGGQQKAGFAA